MTTLVFRGQSDVMRWCGGVTRGAVGNWVVRHPDEVPEPDAIIENEGTSQVTRGWTLDRKDEWMKFAAARLGPDGSRTANAVTTRSVRRAADRITRQAATGEISERTAIELLSGLIGRPVREEEL